MHVPRILVVAGCCAAVLALNACGAQKPAAPAVTAPAASASAASAPTASAPAGAVYAPVIDPATFRPTGDNPLFPLRPGMRWEYRSATADGVETTVVTVTGKTTNIMGVTCVEVRDTVKVDGRLKEDTLDWYAHHADGAVWYFGEDTKEYEKGTVSTKGSWVAGVDGALPGVVMPARPRAGDSYRQEYYRGQAEDMAEVLGTAERVTVPAGGYRGVLKTKDYTPLEPGMQEQKYYAPGVGTVLTVDVAGGGTRDELIKFTG